MENKKQKVNQRVSLLNGFLFLLAAYGFFESGNQGMAMVAVSAAMINIFVGVRKDASEKVKIIWVNFMNLLMAILVAWDYFEQGTNYIHYVWILISILYLGVIIIHFIKKNKASKTPNE